MMFEVYMHTSPSGKSYIGWTSRGTATRWKKHVWDALKGASRFPLHCAIRRYGPEKFSTTLLERVSSEKAALLAESLWVRELGTFVPNGYNATMGGGGVVGRKLSAETLKKMSAAMTGKKLGPHSAQTKAKMSASAKGRVHTPEARAKMSASRLGSKRTPESIAKTVAFNTGHRWSPEQRARHSERMKGRKVTPEHREKISATLKMKHCTPAAVLTIDQVLEIKGLMKLPYFRGKCKQIALLFGVGERTICEIKLGRTWRRVP